MSGPWSWEQWDNWYDELESQVKFAEAKAQASKEFHYLGQGRHRETYDIGGGLVLKLPRFADGEIANEDEAAISAGERPYNWFDWGTIDEADLPANPCECFADCVLVDYHGVKALLMEKVTPVDPWVAPAWAKAIDSRQVGLNAQGKIVAWDFTNG
jgi:hypothetical protein